MTVADVLEQHQRLHGASDPRPSLDSHCWSCRLAKIPRFSLGTDRMAHLQEVEQWCDHTLGRDNWYRLFNKFWFTDQQQLIMFAMAWDIDTDGSTAT